MNEADAHNVADEIIFNFTGRHLTDLESALIIASWKGLAYQEIKGYDGKFYNVDYLKSVGAKLWKVLSDSLGERVHKQNFKKALERYLQRRDAVSVYHNSRIDWGESPHLPAFFGRESELNELKHQILTEECRLVTIWGMGGIGKTSLAVKLIEHIESSFELVIWRSLVNAPRLGELLEQLVPFLSSKQMSNPQISSLLSCLRTSRCLLVLDNWESLFQPGKQTGSYRTGYEDYGDLLEAVGKMRHQSCLILTSRERPFESVTSPGAYTMRLSGNFEVSQQIVRSNSLSPADDIQIDRLCERYNNNPLAVRLALAFINEIFEGNISYFIETAEYCFGDIRRLLEIQFERASFLEKNLMLWLSISREPTHYNELAKNVFVSKKDKINDALDSLSKRSLIESKGSGYYGLQPVLMEYITDVIIELMFTELEDGEMNLFKSYPLIQPTGKDYVVAAQKQFILDPIKNICGFSSLPASRRRERILELLNNLRQRSQPDSRYGIGNLINLATSLEVDLTDFDFSNSFVCHADLRDIPLYNTNFSNSSFHKTCFTNMFGGVFSVAFSPSQKLFAASDTNGKIHFWSLPIGQQEMSFRGSKNWVPCITFSPSGNQLASGNFDTNIRLWNATTGQCISTLCGHQGPVISVDFSPCGRYLASGSMDGTVRVWNIETGDYSTIENFVNNTSGESQSTQIYSVCFSPDGKFLARGAADGNVKIWSMETYDFLEILEGHEGPVWSIDFSLDGKTLASGSWDSTIRIWDVNSWQCLRIIQGHRGRVFAVNFSPIDIQTLASSSADQHIKVWDVSNGNCLHNVHAHHNWVWSIDFTPDGQKIVSGSYDSEIKIWDLNAQTCRCSKHINGFLDVIYRLSFSSDGRLISSHTGEKCARVWDMNEGICLLTLKGHSSWVMCSCFSQDGRILATASYDQTIRIWDAQTGNCIRVMNGHNEGINFVAFSFDGLNLASGSSDNTIKIWDSETGECLRTLGGHSDAVHTVIFSPNREFLASCSHDQTIKIWDVETGKLVKSMGGDGEDGHSDWIYNICFCPSGRFIASASHDKTVKLWNLQSGHCLATLSRHSDWVWSVCFNPDGKYLTSASKDGSVNIWVIDSELSETLNISHYRTLHIENFQETSMGVFSAIFNPDGNVLAVSGQNEFIIICDVETGETLRSLRTPKLYEGMNISGARGLSLAQEEALVTLGAIKLRPRVVH